MKRLLATLPVLFLAAACGSSGGATKTVTVTRTVTNTVTAQAAAPTDTSSSSAAAEAGPDACSLLTQAEADAVASTPLQKPTQAGIISPGVAVMCQWIGLTNGPTAELEVYVGDGAAQQLHIDKDNLKHTFTTVPGIGDQCLQEDGFIFIQKNDLWVSIHLVRLNDAAANVKPMQTGAAEIAAKLP
jgi:hypothetical protein